VKVLIKKKGFTLIEMALVIMVIGIIVSAVTSIVPEFIQSGKIKKTQAIVDKNIYAIEGWIAANGRCPCPDTDGDGLENFIDFGFGPDWSKLCGVDNIYEGGLPYRTLGLSSGQDSWGTALRYAVYDNSTKTSSSDLCERLGRYVSRAYIDTMLHTVSGGVTLNQAYAVVSAGPDKDFDDNNTILNMKYEIPGKMGDPDYDDILSVCSFVFLHGKHCSGYLYVP
jgi:prepilin-type N-terminal cleavage/methylation domain-containing protein